MVKGAKPIEVLSERATRLGTGVEVELPIDGRGPRARRLDVGHLRVEAVAVRIVVRLADGDPERALARLDDRSERQGQLRESHALQPLDVGVRVRSPIAKTEP